MTLSKKVICEHCGYDNPAGALICRRCYRLLTKDGTLPKATMGTTEKLGTKRLDESIDIPPELIDKVDEPLKPFGSTLRLVIVSSGEEIVKSFRAGTLLIGRSDAARRIKPDIDLNPHQAYSHGVSRTHALIRQEKNRLLVQDLDSANHTYINDVRLTPHTPNELRHKDILKLGMFVMQVFFD